MNSLEKRIQVGNCSASIFTREVETLEGNRMIKDVVLQRNYKDKEGKYQHANSYGVNDLPKAILALQKAYEHLVYGNGNQDRYQKEDKP